jgi:ectoine hydroxylase-related dioxygenase (phytanoyl-CoA dioxygenase family)
MRKVPPETGSSWHQDGAFLGTEKHTLNMWVALSDCGERASGLDVVARRFDSIVTTGTEGAFFDWDVSPDVVEEVRGSDPIVAPVFAAGDAVFFDQFLLHKTGTNPAFTDDRYALETWFFTPSSFPGHYSGLLV